MADGKGSSNVAIVALIVIMVLVVGGVLYFTGAFGGRDTTVIEVPTPELPRDGN
jgi:hypothetical protein